MTKHRRHNIILSLFFFAKGSKTFMEDTVMFNGRRIMLQTIEEKIQQRRQQILVHSFIYYQLNDNIVKDSDYDRWSKELVELQNEYPEESKKARYYEAFKNFDGSSGFDLPYTEPRIQAIAHQVLREHKRNVEWRNTNA